MSNNTNPDPQQSQQHQAPAAGIEQFLAAQTQLLTNMVNTIANVQAQMNQAPPLLATDRQGVHEPQTSLIFSFT
jgi:hypothetical protein